MYQSDPQKVYAYMVHMYYNVETPRKYSGDSSKLTNWILDSGATCHMTPNISDFILGSLVEIEKYIQVADVNFLTEKKQEKFK